MLADDQILRAMRDEIDHPATVRELLQALKIPREERPAFRRRLKHLVATGALIETRNKHYGLPEKMDLVVGRLEMHPQGYAFVRPESQASPDGARGLQGDIYIASHNLHDAMHGDRVVVRVERQRDRRAEGKIVRILERSSSTVVGRYVIDATGVGYVVPFDRRILQDIHVPGETRGAQPGEMVTAEIIRWPTAQRNPVGRVIEVLGDIDAPGVDIQIIIRKYGIPDAHSDESITEANRLGGIVREKDLVGRTDFRNVATVTIDGEHARDFDDAITIEKLANGNYWLGVHIADVSHYVREGSALDGEAYERATSVYFPERAVHMFPSELSTGLCSLNPDVDRLVQSCVMEVNKRGDVVRYEMHDGVIHSNARMTYTDVNRILTDKDEDTITRYIDLVPMFEMMGELFHILNARRRRRGSIDFDLPEAEFVLDEKGQVEEILAAERNIAHRLIEEFMLLANETVARHLVETNTPSLHRIHESPDPMKVEEFDAFISTFGHTLPGTSQTVQPKHFQKLVERIRGTPEERAIAMLMLRTMQKARYDAQDLGHFGLAAEHYTHFTSPIRRYPDLIVHRTLREQRHGLASEDKLREREEELPEIARHTSEMERRANEAERELVGWKKVRFMADKVGEEFDGYIIGVAPFGLFVELIDHFVEGLVHISTMADDYYRYDERGHALRGENTEKVYRLGDRARVQVTRVDMERRQVELGLTDILDAVRESERNRGPRRSSMMLPAGAGAYGGPGSYGKHGARGKGAHGKGKAGKFGGKQSGGRAAAAAAEREQRRAGRKQRPGRRERAMKKGGKRRG
jgi:ribonuclease R